MILVERTYNFNAPIEAVTVFRYPVGEIDHNGDAAGFQEHCIKFLFGWEDIKSIEEYAYPDNWKTYKGEKYCLSLHNEPPRVILGSYDSMKAHWTAFRMRYPIFIDENQQTSSPKSSKKKTKENPE